MLNAKQEYEIKRRIEAIQHCRVADIKVKQIIYNKDGSFDVDRRVRVMAFSEEEGLALLDYVDNEIGKILGEFTVNNAKHIHTH